MSKIDHWVAFLIKKQQYFHRDIKCILFTAQAFSILPISGILSNNPKSLEFSWCSLRVLYTLFSITGNCFSSCTSFYRSFITNKITLHKARSFVFNANSAIAGIVFLNLAQRWPKLIRKWSEIEASIEPFNKNQHLRRKFYAILFGIIAAAIIEHVLSITYVWLEIPDTDPNKFESYFRRNYPHFFDFFAFSTPLAMFAVIMNVLNVFSWNFLDAFLMIISVALTHKFKEITSRVTWAYKSKVQVKHHWMKLREDYHKVSILCKIVNKEIAHLIVVSFATNMFFIMAQLYRSLNLQSSFLESAYFTFSFSLLLFRTISVTLCASNIHDESKKSMSFLLSMNSDTYNNEIERFAYQIHCQPVALTGNDFFTITRSLLFGMAGAIVTYELFLIQSIHYDD